MTDRAQLARQELARRELERRGKPVIKPMYSSPEEAAAGQEKVRREQFELEQGVKPLGVVAKGANMATSGLMNAAAFGLPDIISKKITGKPYVDPDSKMQGLSNVVGALSGGAGTGARLIGEAALPVIKGGIRMSAKGIPTVIKDTMMRKAGRGAIEGAVAGASQLSSDEEGNVSAGQQATQGVLGGLLGAAAIPAGAFVSKMGRTYQRWNYFRKNPKIPKGTELISKIDKTKQGISLNAAEREAGQRGIKENFTEKLASENKRLNDNFKNLASEYHEGAETGAIKFQDSTKFVIGDMGEGYGAHLDEISDDLISSGQQITNGELSSNVFSTTKANLQENMITSGHVVNMINKMEAKYGEKLIATPSKFNYASTGTQATKSIKSNVDDVVNFKSLVKDIKDIKKGIKYGGSTEDNVALGIFYDDLTRYLGQRPGLEKYLELNSTYAPYINSAKTLLKQAKSYVGESQTAAATDMLKRFGLRKAGVSPTETGFGIKPAYDDTVRNIERLQQPSPFSKGMGTEVTDPIVAKAQKLVEAKQATEDIAEIISAQRKSASKALDQRFMNDLDTLMGSNKYVESDYTLKKTMIMDALDSKLKQIGYREDQRRAVLASRDAIGKLIRKFTGATAATSGTVYGGKAIGAALIGK